MNIGLAASRSLRQGARSQLARLLKRHAPFLRTANVFAVGGTWDAIRRTRALGSHASLHRLPRVNRHARQTVALIAHDRHKRAMIAFARKHFALLSRFNARVATGTTGRLLNAMARKRGVRDWVVPMLSGPLGGDAQIARMLLDGECDRVIFFEDPHVARQHEADIQLLERAARVAGERAICVNDPLTATRWADAMSGPDGRAQGALFANG